MNLPYKTIKGIRKYSYFHTSYGSKIYIGDQYSYLNEGFLVIDKDYKVLKVIPIEKEP